MTTACIMFQLNLWQNINEELFKVEYLIKLSQYFRNLVKAVMILLALTILCSCIHQVDFSYFLSSYLSIYSLRVFNIIIKSRFKKRLFLYYVQFVSQVKKEPYWPSFGLGANLGGLYMQTEEKTGS